MYVETWGDNHTILYGASLLAIASMGIHWLRENSIVYKNVPFGIWNNIILVIYSIVVGIFVAYNYSSLLSSCITFASFSIVCVAICYVSAEEKSLEWMYTVLIFLAIICSTYMLAFGTEYKGYGRTLSQRNNPHVFAAVMNLGIFSTAYKCRKFDLKEFVCSGFLILLFLYCIVECGSRKYLIVSLFLVAIWGLTYSVSIWKKNDKNQRFLFFLALIIVSLLAIYYYRTEYVNSLSHSRMLNSQDQGNVGRIKMYQYALKIFLDRPLFGGGYDQFKYWSGIGGYAHSTYAEAIADFGFFGCVVYFVPIISVTIEIIKQALYKKKSYSSKLLCAFCISELFIGIGQIFFMEFYLFLAWLIIFSFGGQYYHEIDNTEGTSLMNQRTPCKYIR